MLPSTVRKWAVAAVFACTAPIAWTQPITTPRGPSPAASVAQTIGISTVTVNYSRPSVKGREIWGTLVPYGWNKQGFGNNNDAPWRAGANENTVIRFSHDATVEGKKVPAGTYGLFFVVNKDNTGEVVLSKDSRSWGSFWYEPTHDQLRAPIKVREGTPTELLTYSFDNLTRNSADLVKHTGRNPFDALYEDPARLEQFMEAMVGIQMGAFVAFARGFNFKPYRTLCDMGGATGALSIQVALNNPYMQCITFDLPAVEHIARKWIEKFDVVGRVKVQSGDFFNEPYPKADVITMGNILHDWGYADKLRLAKEAYNALPEGGAFVVIESIIDDERRQEAFGLLMSLNMLIETQAGYDFTFQDFSDLCREAGFRRFELLPLAGPTKAAIAYK